MKAVLFDLDDTLYPEIEFVKSGFRTVARYLSSRYELDENTLFKKMLAILEKDGRGKVFDKLLEGEGIFTEDRVKLLVYLYRSHHPDIQLYRDVLPTLESLKRNNMHLGMVTDGMASVQRNKIAALGLESLFDVIICSDELSKECWKPSTVPYTVALELLQTQPSEAVYVGNDPSKDFIGPQSLGMLTIQVQRNQTQNPVSGAVYGTDHAKFQVKGLSEILPIITGES